MDESKREVTQILKKWQSGDRLALDRLIPMVYDELRTIAKRHLYKERQDHTLATAGLVNEVFMKLVDQNNVDWKNRAQFFGISAQIMRRILLDYAKEKNALKRGGDAILLNLEESMVSGKGLDFDILAMEEALTELAKIDPRQCKVVELRFYAGLSVKETAEVLSVSQETIHREWRVAKAWLYGWIKN